MNCRTHRRAFTLVEMIVVVAIIGILTAIAIPSLKQMGLFGRDPVHYTARQVLTMLKAARIYAGTHRVDTAVVYSIAMVPDSKSADPANPDMYPVIDSAAIVRRLTLEEYAYYKQLLQQAVDNNIITPAQRDIYEDSEDIGLAPFIPVKDKEGTFTRFPKGAAIGAYERLVPADLTSPFVLDKDISDWGEVAGFCSIRLLNRDMEPVDPRTFGAMSLEYPLIEPPNPPDGGLRFPAHVFKPSGVLQVGSGTEVSRFKVGVIPAPDADIDVRYVQDEASGTDVLVTPGRIQIFGATGRVESES